MYNVFLSIEDFYLMIEIIKSDIQDFEEKNNYNVIEAFNGKQAAVKFRHELAWRKNLLYNLKIMDQYVAFIDDCNLRLNHDELHYIIKAIKRYIKRLEDRLSYTNGEGTKFYKEELNRIKKFYDGFVNDGENE